jgi:hypothetical protein
MKRIALKYATTKLERAALRWINGRAADYETGAAGAVKDLLCGGCQSGMVSELIYYRDTVKFYRKHKTDISALLKDVLENSGCKGPAELFGDKWESNDPLASDDMNQNLLAWFGFEEAARNVCSRAGLDV